MRKENSRLWKITGCGARQNVFLKINIQMTLSRGIMQIYDMLKLLIFLPLQRAHTTTSIVKLQTWAINTKRIVVWTYTAWTEIYIIMVCFHYSFVYYNYSYHANDATTHMKRAMRISLRVRIARDKGTFYIVIMCINIFLFHLYGFWNVITKISHHYKSYRCFRNVLLSIKKYLKH